MYKSLIQLPLRSLDFDPRRWIHVEVRSYTSSLFVLLEALVPPQVDVGLQHLIGRFKQYFDQLEFDQCFLVLIDQLKNRSIYILYSFFSKGHPCDDFEHVVSLQLSKLTKFFLFFEIWLKETSRNNEKGYCHYFLLALSGFLAFRQYILQTLEGFIRFLNYSVFGHSK